MQLNSLLIGGGIFAGVGLIWDKIKYFFSRISNMFIEEHYLESHALSTAFKVYVEENFKKPAFQPKYFSSMPLYVKTIKKYVNVGFETCVIKTPRMFHKGLKPMFIIPQSSSNKGDKSSFDDSSTRGFKVVFIRKTFNIEQIIKDALTLYNERFNKNTRRNTRFYIRKHFGSLSTKNQTEMVETDVGQDKVDVFIGDKKYIGYSYDDIGEEQECPFEALVFPSYITHAIDDAKHWKDSEQWYRDKMIPWKRGWLLYGRPGTGKTSLVKAIGQYLDLPIHSFDLATMNNQELSHYWDKMLNRTPCIALIEDLDAIFKGRENRLSTNIQKDKLTFDCLLNCISGVQRTDGVFVIITTNNIQDVDYAIGIQKDQSTISSRPGRIDKVLELRELDQDCRVKMAKRILCDYPEEIDGIVLRGNGDTGAQFQERCAQIALRRFWEDKN